MLHLQGFTWAFLLLFTVLASAGQEKQPTSLTCISNAKAWRDYGFMEKVWGKESLFGKSKEFGITTPENTIKGIPLRDKVFSGLDTEKPIVRSITPMPGGEKEMAEEFPAIVVSRADGAVFLLWKNPHGNKVWGAVVDLEHKKATVTSLFRGLLSVGADIETLDCR